MRKYLILLRYNQWVKNLLVFTPIFFAGRVIYVNELINSFVAFAIFCLVASSVYIINDFFDLEQDRLHPKKKTRPLASGAVTKTEAIFVIVVLVILYSVGLHFYPALIPIIILYLLLNILYSSYIKHIAIIDIVCVSLFYILRVLAGGMATETYISPWIILCVMFGSLFIISGKRRAELIHSSQRKVLNSYSRSGLDFIVVSSATLAITAYGLYSVLGSKSDLEVYSTVFVIIAIFRLLNHIFMNNEYAESPETLVFRDKWVLFITICWVLYMFFVFYL